MDFTNTFRALSGEVTASVLPEIPAAKDWQTRWQARLVGETDPQAVMRAANPFVIPRNHRIEQMITAAVAGDLAPFQRLLAVLARPFDDQPEAADLTAPPAPHEVVQATFCGT